MNIAPNRQLISADEAIETLVQHTRPCCDCPFAKTALNGWLGGSSIEAWRQIAHSDAYVPCHTMRNQQCAGIAIYRRNVCKRVEPPLLVLPRDTDLVFDTPMAFAAHHARVPTTELPL